MVVPVWISVLALSGWLAWTRLAAPLFERGTVLLGAIGLYFFIVHRLKWIWPKELAVAVLFALGVSLAAWGHIQSPVDAATIVLFSCLCWINCAAIEKWESDKWGSSRTADGPWPPRLCASPPRR